MLQTGDLCSCKCGLELLNMRQDIRPVVLRQDRTDEETGTLQKQAVILEKLSSCNHVCRLYRI